MLETEDPGCDLSPNRDITLLEISLIGFTLQYFKLNKTDEHFSHALLNTFLVYIRIIIFEIVKSEGDKTNCIISILLFEEFQPFLQLACIARSDPLH